MDQALNTVRRAREWVTADTRVRAALVHGSVARNDTTPLSDVDLVLVAEPGSRDALWAERDLITRRLLGDQPTVAWEVPHQRPYRWQARTAQLDMLDLTVDEGTVDVWPGLAGDVEFLVDRGGVREAFDRAVAELTEPEYDPAAECDTTWGIFGWLAGQLLHQRTVFTRAAWADLLNRRVLPLLERPWHRIGSIGDDLDRQTIDRLDAVSPRSSDAAELARGLQATAVWYAELLTDWAERSGRRRPTSILEPGTLAALRKLTRGELQRPL